ncbi:MAG: Mov34/MPN/PAD-1 family protein [Proteobacteria bacterium]|nr:Mov34/MPN/PAD-1 family protein [Pseudomonadota bacterium]
MSRVRCSSVVLALTIEALRRGGRIGQERVALWLAPAAARDPVSILEVYEPEQEAEFDYFRLPPESMRSLLSHLATTRQRIVAQIHTHPGTAYHSKADAKWAIVRHLGALSLVLPRFARSTTPGNFLSEAKIYECTGDGEWSVCASLGPAAPLEVIL